MTTRIPRRLVRKLIKPFCLWLATMKQTAAEQHAERYRLERKAIYDMERDMLERAVVWEERRNLIQKW